MEPNFAPAHPAPVHGLEAAHICAAQEILGRLEGRPGEREEWDWAQITHGGSDRVFYRVRSPGGPAWVVLHYSEARQENAYYADIAGFLAGLGLQVPRPLFHDRPLRLMGFEDLGEVTLHDCARGSPRREKVMVLYRDALGQAARLHRRAGAPVPLMHGFDAELYRWERRYFRENLLGRWAGMELSEDVLGRLEAEGERLAGELLRTPRCLIHRDFQSQNLMVRGGRVWMIDFQGLRLGHAAYDVASLLYDPYVALSEEQREELADDYVRYSGESAEAFSRQLDLAAAQRLMQALGAYGFLGLVRAKPAFLRHIRPALRSLRLVLQRAGGMEQTLECLDRIGPHSG